MVSLRECAAISGLSRAELVELNRLEPILRRKAREWHRKLLSSYLTNMDKGAEAVCGLLLADLHGCLDLGARRRAADLLIVMRLLLAEFPILRRGAVPKFSWSADANSACSCTAETRSSPLKIRASVTAPPNRSLIS
jgi:hypothetical protein